MKQQHSVLRGAGPFLLALLLSIIFCSPLLAQLDISGQVVGTVTDPSGAVVPKAELGARNELTGVETKTASDARGGFLFPSLLPGTYTVTCKLAGFQTFITSGIVLQAGKTVTLPITLIVGATTQTVQVSGAATMVNTVAATIQTTFDDRILDAVPIFGRDPRETMELLMPGAVAGGTGMSNNVQVTSFNGIPGLDNNYRVDGSDTNDYFHGSASATPPIEDLAEFSVTTSVSDSSMALGAGGQIESVTKSGTSDLHGQGWGYFQNSAWNANSWQNNWLGVPKAHLSQQWYGGNVGGPVFIPHVYNGKGKTFFFTSYERTSTSTTSTSAGTTLTAEEREGDFSNSPDGIPVIKGVPTPYINPATFTPMGTWLATHTNALPEPTNGVDTYVWQPHETAVVTDFIGRIDHNFSEKNRLFGSLWWDRNLPTFNDVWYVFGLNPANGQYPNPNLTQGYPNKLQTWTLNDTYTISPTTLNDFIVGVKRLLISVTNNYSGPSTAQFNSSELGIGAVGDTGAPDVQEISFPRAMGYGLWNGYFDHMTQNEYYIADNFTTIKGRHTLKGGVEIRHYNEVKVQTFDAGAQITFADANVVYGGSGNGVADMLLGLAPTLKQHCLENVNLEYPAREAYLQDTFKVTKNLTLMYGLRWEPFLGVRSADNALSTFVPGQQSTEFPTAPLGVVVVGDRGIPTNLTGDKLYDIGPRASLAWDIFGNGKASFRAGAAETNSAQVLLTYTSFSVAAPWGVTYTPNQAAENLVNPYQQYTSVVGKAPFPWTIPTAGAPSNTSFVFPNPLSTQAKNPNYNNASVFQWNFNLDFEPIKTYLFSVGYVATRGTHLDEQQDFDWPRFVPGASSNVFANVQSRRPWGPEGMQSIYQDSTDFNSLYNSLQVRFTKRYSQGLAFMGNYTLSSSKTLNNGLTVIQQATAGANGPRYYGDWALDYYSPGMMQNFAMAFSYHLPIPTGSSRLAKAFLGGWTTGGDVTGISGQYGAVTDYNCSQFNYGSAGCDATFTGGSPYSTSRGETQMYKGSPVGVSYLNPSKFLRADQTLVNGVPTTSPNVGQELFLGNAIIGTYKGPATFMLNASLSKTFAITERFKLNYRIEATNALNHTVLTLPDTTYSVVQPDMSHFGVIDSALSPRLVQMSAHFIF